MRKPKTKVKRIDTAAVSLRTCKHCGGSALKRKVATYPVPLTGKLAGRRLDIYRVELDECRYCGLLMPTDEGKAKVMRCTKTGIDFFLKNLP